MSKLFLLIVFAAIVYLLLKRGNRRSAGSAAGPGLPPSEHMIQCAHCHVHLPLSESVSDEGRRYCCEEHRRLGRG
jgi:uncharacterized protein